MLRRSQLSDRAVRPNQPVKSPACPRFFRFNFNGKADLAAAQLLEFLVFLVLASALFFCSEALSK